jgi:hypothetical protein
MSEQPLRLKQVFFFRESAAELYPLRTRRRDLLLLPVAGVIVFSCVEMMLRDHSRTYARPWNADEIMVLLNLIWPAAEFVFFFFGSFAAAPAERWRQSHRLEELALTPLRPVSIGQILLAPGIRNVDMMLAVSAGAFMLSAAAWQTIHVWIVIPLSLIAFNAALTARMSAWAQISFSLGLGKRRALFAVAVFFAVFAVSTIPVWFVFGLIQAAIYDKTASAAAFVVALIPASLALAALKFLYTRAYAAHLETAVMPYMEHS